MITTEKIEKLRARVDPSTHSTLALRKGTAKPARLRPNGVATRTKRKRLIKRESLDGRCAVAKAYDTLVAAIRNDLGGSDELSAIELALVEAFAGAAVTLDHLNGRILTGAEIDNAIIQMHSQAINGMVKVGARLGLSRRSKSVMDLDTFLAARAQEKAACEREPSQ